MIAEASSAEEGALGIAMEGIAVPDISTPAVSRVIRLGEQLAFMASYFSRIQVTQADELRELRGFRDLVDQLAQEVLECSCCSLDDGRDGDPASA